jgi:hypothetical protein
VSAEEPRYFTPQEAEALLPEIDGLLGTAQELLARLEQLQQRQEREAHTNGQVLGRGVATPATEDEPRTIQNQLRAIIGEVQARGVILRDIRTGLIDFPSHRAGEAIFLCWQRGEPMRIEWWHPTDTGIAGRQRL